MPTVFSKERIAATPHKGAAASIRLLKALDRAYRGGVCVRRSAFWGTP